MKLDAGSRIDFVIDADGQVKVIPLNVPAKALSGILHRQGMESSNDRGNGASDRAWVLASGLDTNVPTILCIFVLGCVSSYTTAIVTQEGLTAFDQFYGARTKLPQNTPHLL